MFDGAVPTEAREDCVVYVVEVVVGEGGGGEGGDDDDKLKMEVIAVTLAFLPPPPSFEDRSPSFRGEPLRSLQGSYSVSCDTRGGSHALCPSPSSPSVPFPSSSLGRTLPFLEFPPPFSPLQVSHCVVSKGPTA